MTAFHLGSFVPAHNHMDLKARLGFAPNMMYTEKHYASVTLSSETIYIAPRLPIPPLATFSKLTI